MAIEIPTRIKNLPVYGGYPVPCLVMWANGVPDFRVTDMEKWAEVVNGNLCGICGQPNDYWLYFIGGPESMNYRLFFDPAMHQECAKYALKVCPYMATGRDRSYRPVRAEGVVVHTNDAIQNIERPDRFGLGRTRGYDIIKQEGKLLLKAKSWASITWWANGEPLV